MSLFNLGLDLANHISPLSNHTTTSIKCTGAYVSHPHLPYVSPLTEQRDENGKPYVLESVLKAEDILHQQRSDKEYLPITVRPST